MSLRCRAMTMLHAIIGYRRKLFFLLWLGTIVPLGGNYSIVFVHLGTSLPGYLNDALAQARLFNPGASLYLIANKVALAEPCHQGFISENKISTIECEQLSASAAHRKFMAESKLDSNFREGFWKKASERFFYLEELISRDSLQHVFHLESDNMLYVDLEKLLPTFEEYSGIAAVFDSDERCIPSFVYIACPDAIRSLVDYMARNVSRGLDDMYMLAAYRRDCGKQKIELLPLIMPEYVQDYPLQKNQGGTTVREPGVFYARSDRLSIFDAAALGQYLGGIDPRNGPSKPGFVNESCIFNPSRLSFEWIMDDQNRRVPFAVYRGNKYRINNLHIHSKNLSAFKS